MNVELTRFKVKKGKSERVGDHKLFLEHMLLAQRCLGSCGLAMNFCILQVNHMIH